MLEIAEARAAIFLLDRDAVQAERAELRPEIARELVRAVDLVGARRDLRLGEGGHRLADRVLDGLRDPSWFADQTGKSQFLPSGRDLAWIAFYARRFPDRFAGRVPDGAVFQSPRLGGDLTVLAEKWVRN